MSPTAARRLLLGSGLTALGLLAAQAPHPADATTRRTSQVDVIVRGTSVSAATAAVLAHAGTVRSVLPIVDGVAARIPAGEAGRLRTSGGVLAVAPDGRVAVSGAATTSESASPPSVYRVETRADRALAAGYAGAGVTVAVLDTGISPSGDLAGRLVPVHNDVTGRDDTCVNLSGQPTCADDYGHGTFLAGLIAGSGAASGGRYKGVAPSSRLVSIKVGGADGSADVSNVLAGIQWAVSFKARYDISILNLSLSTDSRAEWRSDPFNYAVERAWAAGIAVVVAASNRGPLGGTISKPGDDPWVITVGSIDDKGTGGTADDRLPDYTARGPAANAVLKPDVVAPGSHLVSLRAVGSTIDRQFPTYIAGAYHQGSGTSMATAVVSGVLAQALSAHPGLTPDQLKYALRASAHPIAGGLPRDVGRGIVDAYALSVAAPPGRANVGLGRSTGLGLDPLDSSRGTERVTAQGLVPVVVNGLLTAQLVLWEPAATTLLPNWTEATWYASPWLTAQFRPTTWAGSPWVGHNWEGCSWNGAPEDTCDYGSPTAGSIWYGAWD